jgi:CopG family transcriptional regulator, nickel-responsive regulator
MKTVRLSFSMDTNLLERWEKMLRESGYVNRSEFIRDMIRDRLVEEEWERDDEAVGTLTLIYNHHSRGLTEKLTHLQHDHHNVILATTHVHLDAHICVEVILVKGKASQIREMINLLRQQKGVLHGSLAITSTGKHLA